MLRPVSFERGTVIAGKYRVDRVIGQGGMGIVLAAKHLGLDEMVALKLIREGVTEDAEVLARFQREARAAARIKSEHVARVLDVDRLPEGAPYIVMELIDGTDLDALLERRGPLPSDEAASYITQACEGLAEAHALGMVHRDLKLKNLFLTHRRDGRPLIKVIDFGVVKLTPIRSDEAEVTPRGSTFGDAGRSRVRDATLTGTSVLIGSVHYMAPEQIRASSVVTAQADVWSLGVCLYRMLTGVLPFRGSSIVEVCASIQGRAPLDVREIVPHIPEGMANAVTRSLEKDARRRFADVAELANALAPYGPDPAAPRRIEATLQSSVRPQAPPSPSVTQTFDAPAVPRAPPQTLLRGRAESTIDGAGGSLAAYPAPPAPPTSRRWMAGTIVILAVCAVTVAIWRPTAWRPWPVQTHASATSSPHPTDPATAAATPSDTPAATATPPPARTSDPSERSGAAAASPPSVPTTKRATRPPPKPPSARASAKADPPSPYDHF